MTPLASISYRGQAARLRTLAYVGLSDYGIDGARLTLLGNDENATFRVDTGESRYLLRIHRITGNPSHPVRTEPQIRSELLWLDALRRDTDLLVPESVPTRAGDALTVVHVEGVPEPRICTLFRWREGRFLHAGLTPAHMERVGTMIATLHDHAEHWTPALGFERGRVGDVSDDAARHMLSMVAALCEPADVATVEEIIRRVRETQQALDREPGSVGLIHGDLHQENYLFHRGRVCAIDFDDCGWGYFLYDLMMPLNEIQTHPRFPDLRAALLRGYRSRRALSSEHERHLEVFDTLKVLILTTWNLDEREQPAFSDWREVVRGNLNWLRRYVDGHMETGTG